jgi:hypothetical protein
MIYCPLIVPIYISAQTACMFEYVCTYVCMSVLNKKYHNTYIHYEDTEYVIIHDQKELFCNLKNDV